ncbi:MAG: ATP-binding protein [Lachnospiraceae bacterium]|nr:ATP-binding protein [Lachnospiraceae bacterium]
MSDAKTAVQSEIIPRLYMKLLPVQIAFVIIGGINAVIDNAFAGNLIGASAMAVTGLFSPVTNLLNGVNALIFGGAQVLCGRYLGKKMAERTRSIFSLDMIIMLIVSIILLVCCEMIPTDIAVALRASDALKGDLATYIRGFAIGLPFSCIGTQFTAFLQLEHQEKRSYAAIITMFGANVLFNWLFVAVFHMGLFGLGLSTSLGNVFFFAIQASYFLGKKAVIRFSLESIVLSDIKDILIYGLPGAVVQFCISARGLIINALIQRFVGPDGLAAYSAIYSFGCVYWAVPAGVTSAVMVLGSVYAGEEDKAGLKILMRTFLTRGVGLVTVAAVIVSACCYILTNMFFHDPSTEVYQMAMIGFILYPLYSPLSTLTIGFSNYYHCLSYEHIVRTISVADGILGVSLFSVLLVPQFGMMGIWAGQLLGCAFCVVLVLAIAFFSNKAKPLNLDRMMLFNKDFGVAEENRIDITVRSMDEVVNLSERVWAFCEKHGITGSRKNYSALCTEELAGNIVQHGFRNKKKLSVDIRISYVNDEIVICFKDDGIPFNPEEASRLFEAERSGEHEDGKTFHNIGLQLVSRISKSMTYQNTFGLNILTIVV